MLLVTPEQMREMDRRTIDDVGIPGIVLMERAALGAVEVLVDHFHLEAGDRVGFLCGGGNNGGDGFAMARLLDARGIGVVVCLLRDPDAYGGDAATNLDVCRRLGIELLDLAPLDETSFADTLEDVDCDVWCDALLGTGLDRDVEGKYALAIDFLAECDAVFSVDVPSGLDGDTGQIWGNCVRADATASFGQIKLGQAVEPGRSHCGELYRVEIGIPAGVVEDVGWAGDLLTPASVRLQPRPANQHKGMSGKVLCIGGKTGTTGAILMAARGALASGAGLVVVGTDAASMPLIAPTVNEVMAAEILADLLEQKHVDDLDERLEWADVVAIGPGMGTNDAAMEVLETVLTCDHDVVVDADALNLLARHDVQFETFAYEHLVMTPHPGEAARLCGCEVGDVLDDPIGTARALAAEWSAVVVLKTSTTVIAGPTGQLAVNASGNPGMATGGMGDALTGMIAARIAERDHRSLFEAVCAAVFAHGAAGDRAAETTGVRGLTVSALLDALPAVWRDLEDAG